MIVCRDCGTQNADDDIFCGGCPGFLEHTGEHIDDGLPEFIEEEPEEEREGLVTRIKHAIVGDDLPPPSGAAADAPGQTPLDAPDAPELDEDARRAAALVAKPVEEQKRTEPSKRESRSPSDSKGEPKAAIQVDVGAAGTDLERRLRGFLPSSEIKVTATGQGLVLSGSVPSAVAAEQALVLTRAFVGSTGSDIVNLLEVGGNHQVMLKVVIAEMSRTVTREFGTNFNALIKAGNGNIAIAGLLGGLTSPAGDGNVLLSEAVNVAAGFSQFGALRQLQVFLDVLDERGLTRILAEPTLVARSGKSASFLVGGEIPIPIAQGGAFGSITVEYHHFGVGLKFTPTVLGPNRIHLEVQPEVSQPDFTFGTEVSGTLVPAFNTRRAATSIELENGQSFVIAGLLNEELRQQVSQYPLLGQIPVLGALFRSSKYQRNETELVIIITPSLVKPLGPGPHRLPTDSFIDPSPWEWYGKGWMEGRPPEPADLIDGEVQDAVQVETQNGGGLIGDAGYEAPAAWDESSNASEETTHE